MVKQIQGTRMGLDAFVKELLERISCYAGVVLASEGDWDTYQEGYKAATEMMEKVLSEFMQELNGQTSNL